MQFGVHVSIAGKIFLAVDRAKLMNCQCMQIFASNPRAWRNIPIKEDSILEFRKRRQATAIAPLVVHSAYLINMGSPSQVIYQKSIEAMRDTLGRAQKLGAEHVVFHVGSHGGMGQAAGIKKVANALSLLLDCCSGMSLLLENTSGSGFFLGSRFEEINTILQYLNWDERVGVCLDTCHAFAAGYDIATRSGLERSLASFDKLIGVDRLKLIHANDSGSALGSRLDRHEHIGKGFIGLRGFKIIVSYLCLRKLPCILETPKMSPEDDIRNLETIRALAGD